MKLLLLIPVLLIMDTAVARAQLFGQRDLGQPLSRRPRAMGSVAELNADAGLVTGSERFIRGNRDRASFVGADQTETQSFVGSQQASTSGVIVSSTAGIEPPPDRSSEINQAVESPPAKKMYLPKIVLGADFIPANRQLARNRFTDRLAQSMRLASEYPIEVLVVERTAILRGVVTSAKEKRLAETLALFEPGISQVENQLQVPPKSLPNVPPPPPKKIEVLPAPRAE